MKIINFGSCNIDFVYGVEHIVVPGETLSGGWLETFPGGKGLNQSIAVSKAGTQVFHAGCVGEDGQMLVDTLKQGGVDTSLVKVVKEKTGHAIIQLSNDGQNSIILYRGANGQLDEKYIDEVLLNLSKGDFVILQNEISGIEYIIDEAYEKGAKIVFNPAPFTEDLKRIDFNKISYLIVNEIEAQGIGGKGSPEQNIKQISDKFKGLSVVLTVGEKGALYTDNGEIKYQPSMKVEVVDTTAGGDTFIGYFVAEITKGTAIPCAVKKATVASALAVTKKGAAVSIPTEEQVLLASNYLKPNRLSKDRKQDLKEKIVDFINANIQGVSLDALASSLGYSNGHTGQLIKEIFGATFSELVKNMRCEYAEKLLVQTDWGVSAIINQVGYENESFFRKAFKNKYGASPKKYRKMKKGE